MVVFDYGGMDCDCGIGVVVLVDVIDVVGIYVVFDWF